MTTPTEPSIDLALLVSLLRTQILGDSPSTSMCLTLCASLEPFLRSHGVHTHAVAGSVFFAGFVQEHFWLQMADGSIIDPTADQFPTLNLPPVYIGKLPTAYVPD